MARGALFFNKARGKVGNVVLSVMGGQQISRAYNESNSNKGDNATELQREQRVKLGNLINVYRLLKKSELLAFATKDQKMSDYNAFIQANLSNNMVALTRDEFQKGFTMIDDYIVSKGGLGSIFVTTDDEFFSINYYFSEAFDFTNNKTLGYVSTALMNAIPWLADGDLFTLVLTHTTDDGTTSVSYKQVKIDSTSTETFDGTKLFFNTSFDPNDQVNFTLNNGNAAVIVTRKVNGSVDASYSKFDTSTNTFVQNHKTAAAWLAAKQSYGYKETPMLNPDSVD